MSIPLADALSQVDLEPGQTYRCKVNGFSVVVWVGKETTLETTPVQISNSDIMLDAWMELPGPETAGGIATRSRLGEPDVPDIPDIPSEEPE